MSEVIIAALIGAAASTSQSVTPEVDSMDAMRPQPVISTWLLARQRFVAFISI